MGQSADLQTLRKQYFSLYPPHLINLKLEPRLTLARNQGWIYHHLLSSQSLAGDYPPANDYQRKFWKLLVAALEDELRDDQAVIEELELDDRIAEHYTELIAHSTNPFDVPGPSYKTYIYDHPTSPPEINSSSDKATPSTAIKEKAITLLEAQTTIEAGSTGLRTWTASLHLATLLISDPTLLEPPFWTRISSSGPSSSSSPLRPRTNFLELGAGTGFLSCFLAQTGERTIWATDIGDEGDVDADDGDNDDDDEKSVDGEDVVLPDRSEGLRRGPLKSLKSNLKINRTRFHPGSKVISRCLDWFDSIPPEAGHDSGEPYGAACKFSASLPDDLVLLAADVIYDPDLVIPLVATLKMFLSVSASTSGAGPSNRFALLAATVRNQETTDLFERECARAELKVSIVPSSAHGHHNTTPVFWNASTWEGQDVRVVEIWI